MGRIFSFRFFQIPLQAHAREKRSAQRFKKNQFCPRVPKDALECMVASNPSVLGFGLLNQAPISAIP